MAIGCLYRLSKPDSGAMGRVCCSSFSFLIFFYHSSPYLNSADAFLLADSFHIKKLVADLLRDKCTFWRKTAILCFWSFSFGTYRQRTLFILGSLESPYNSRLPISHNWTFFARWDCWNATSEYWLKICVVEGMGKFVRKFQVERVVPTKFQQPFFFRKTEMIELSCGVKLWQKFFSFLSQFTRLTDRQTNGRTV